MHIGQESSFCSALGHEKHTGCPNVNRAPVRRTTEYRRSLLRKPRIRNIDFRECGPFQDTRQDYATGMRDQNTYRRKVLFTPLFKAPFMLSPERQITVTERSMEPGKV